MAIHPDSRPLDIRFMTGQEGKVQTSTSVSTQVRFIPPPAETAGVLLEQQDRAGSIIHSCVSILMTYNEDGWCVRVPSPPTAQQSNSRPSGQASLLERPRGAGTCPGGLNEDLPVEGA